MKVFAVLLLASLAAGAPVSQKRFYIYDQPSTHSLADHSHVALFADEFERSGAAPLPVTRYSIATRSVYDKPVIVVVPQEGKEELSAILIDGGLSSLKQNPSLHFLHDRLRLGDEQVGVMLGAAKHFPLRQNDMPVSKFYLPENYKLSKAAELQADIGMVPWMLIAKRTDLEGLNFDKLKIISEYNIEDDQVRVVKDYHTELRNSEAGPAFYRLPTSQYAFAAPLAGSLSEGLYQRSSSQAYNPLLKGVMSSVFGVPAYIQKNIYYLQPSSLAGESLDSRILYHAPANAFVRGEYDLMRKYPFKFSTSDENAAVFDEAISSHIPSRRSNLRVEELKQIISGTPLSHHAAEEIMTSHQRASLAGLNSQINEAHVSSLGNAESLKTTKTISSEGRSISGSTEQLTPGNIKTVTTTTITKESIPSGSYVEANNLGSVKTTLLNKDHILSMPVEGHILRGESSIIPSEIMSSASKSSMTTSSSSNLEASRDVNSFVKSTVHGFESLPSSSSKTIKTTTVVTKEIVPQTQTSTFVEYLPVSRSSMTTSSASIHGQTSMDVDSRSSVVPASGSKTVKTSTFVTKEINPVSSIEGHILASDESLAKMSQLGSSSTKTTVITSSASGHEEASKNIDSSLMSSIVPAEGLLSSGSKTVKTSTVVTKQINPVSSIEGHFLASDESLAKKSELGSSSTKTTVISSSASGHEEASKDIDSSLRSSIVSADGLSASGSKTIKTTTVVTKEVIPGATQVGSTILNGDISSLKTGLLGSSGSTKTTVYTSSASDEAQVAKDIDSILKSSIIPSESLSSSGSTKTTKTTVVTSSASDDAQVSKDIDSILKGSIIPSESLSSSGSTKTTKTTVVSSSASDEAQLTKDIDSIVKDSIIPL